ncbi:MAG: adenylosuccinate synthase [Synergistaceae bacterium]|nr:adenylosuccinate synthase [Synergistaceae bacterium]
MKGKVDVLVGALWGDEGKGKVVDTMGADVDIFVRYQGGANAGHTVTVDGQKIVFNLLPSGMLYPGKLCVLGNGVVVDPEEFLKEVDELHRMRMDRARLAISSNAHVVMPYHKILDCAQEAFRGKGGMIGTTGRGIGPCYADKCARSGVRMEDLLDEVRLRDAVSAVLEEKNLVLTKLYGKNPLPFDEVYEPARDWGKALAPYVEDTVALLNDSFEKGKYILLEGAQGTLMDVDHGTYPYVTSSSTVMGGGFTGTGMSPACVDRVIAVTKGYTTRSSWGPMPTEEKGEVGEYLRDKGAEFGNVTGRPRRCGWLDIVALRYSMRLNGCSAAALMKLNVLSGMDEIKVCVAYDLDGVRTERFPGSAHILAKCRPIFESLRGWDEDISNCDTFESLPAEAQNYVNYIEDHAGAPVKLIGVGPDRNQTINRGL